MLGPRPLTWTVTPYTLTFLEPAGTSRGVYRTRPVWYLTVTDDRGHWGVGECAPLLDLSMEAGSDYEDRLKAHVSQINEAQTIDWDALKTFPSLIFGLEGALAHLSRQTTAWGSPRFANGHEGIPINGLIWMGDYDTMLTRIEAKLNAGFRCVKLKIGAIDFEKECALLHHIRAHYGPDVMELRVDANGAFTPRDAMDKLKALAPYHLHSIEQPIRQGQWEVMGELARTSPIPIALDEELIGVVEESDKRCLLEAIHPQYLVLKPTLHGGLRGSREWMELAKTVNAKTWVTSALESNIGLNTIAQWCSTLNPTMPQGLGTGALYERNVELALRVKGDALYYEGGSLSADWWARLNNLD